MCLGSSAPKGADVSPPPPFIPKEIPVAATPATTKTDTAAKAATPRTTSAGTGLNIPV